MRETKQRTAVAEALSRAGGFRTAQQLHQDIHQRGGSIGLATVYRQLGAMTLASEVDVLHPPGGEAIYRLCLTRDHHHHLVCRTCGSAVEIESPDVEEWAKRTGRKHRFRAVVHTAELYGTCSSCS